MSNRSEAEQRNIKSAHEFMYNLMKHGGLETIKHLLAKHNSFSAPSTFPGIKTIEQYVQTIEGLIKIMPDVHIDRIELELVENERVALRYMVHGTHKGAPYFSPMLHKQIDPTGKTFKTDSTLWFIFDQDGHIKSMAKDWNKLHAWAQLGWPVEDCLVFDPVPK